MRTRMRGRRRMRTRARTRTRTRTRTRRRRRHAVGSAKIGHCVRAACGRDRAKRPLRPGDVRSGAPKWSLRPGGRRSGPPQAATASGRRAVGTAPSGHCVRAAGGLDRPKRSLRPGASRSGPPQAATASGRRAVGTAPSGHCVRAAGGRDRPKRSLFAKSIAVDRVCAPLARFVGHLERHALAVGQNVAVYEPACPRWQTNRPPVSVVPAMVKAAPSSFHVTRRARARSRWCRCRRRRTSRSPACPKTGRAGG